MKVDKAQKNLSKVWFIWSAFLWLLMIVYTITGRFEGVDLRAAWDWFLPLNLPPLALMVSTFAISALSGGGEKKSVDRRIFVVGIGLSCFYLFVLTLILLANPLQFTKTPTVVLMQSSMLFLGPINGLVTSALGVFFVSQSVEAPKENNSVALDH